MISWLPVLVLLVLLALIVLVARGVVRVSLRPGRRIARCAACRGTPDRETLRCGKCGGDVREIGLDPPDAGAVPEWLRACLTCTILLPILGAILFGITMAVTESNVSFVREDALAASAAGPASGAYGAVNLSSQRAGPRARRGGTMSSIGLAIIGFEDVGGAPLESLIAVRGLADEGMHIETREGEPLTPESLAAWMMTRMPGLGPDQAGREAKEILHLLAHLRNEWSMSPDDRLATLENEGITEAMRDLSLRTGILLSNFETWEAPSGRGSSGGSGPSVAPARLGLWIALAIWLLAVAIILRGARARGASA